MAEVGFDCYLVVELDYKTLRAVKVRTYSAPPWTFSRVLGGKWPIYAVLYESLRRSSYEAAKRDCLSAYAQLAPELAAAFPLSEDD